METVSKEIITNIYPFNELSKKQKQELIKFCYIKEYRPQEFIYRENDPPDKTYVLVTGRLIALSKHNQEDIEIELIKKGVIFGIISLFTQEPHSVSVKAIEKSFVLEIPNEKLKSFLSKTPALTIKLSQLFSQRIKKRVDKPKKIFLSTKVAITSLADKVGKTTFLVNIAKSLSNQTSKKIIIVQFSFSDNFSLSLEKGIQKILDINQFSEQTIERYINADGFNWLCVRINRESLDSIFSLINYLCENYHFVIFELPALNQGQIKDIVDYADFSYLLSLLDRDEAGIINNLLSLITKESAKKLKVISCDFLGKREELDFQIAIYATIPDFNRTDYNKALRRIARELSGKTIGLVLGSGVTFGFAHIGVLEVLEENDIPIDIITGSSMGALIAALWALGYSTGEIKEIASIVSKKLSKSSFRGFSFSLPFRGFFRAKKFEGLLKEIFDEKTFYDLKHALRIMAFDFVRREAKVIKEGLLYKAVAASCSMPGVFEPVIFKDDIYFDGGILNPLPVRAIVDYARKIIAINVTPSKEEIIKWYRQRRGVFNIFDFIFGSIETMQREFVLDALKVCDVSIHPDLEGLNWIEFSKLDEFVKRGRQAALEKLEEIKRLVNN